MGELRAKIAGTGLGIPSKVVTNFDLEKIVDTSDEWIQTRTGIKERRFLDFDAGESLHKIAIEAADEAIKNADLDPKEIGLVVVCTTSEDTYMPITAGRVADAIGASNAGIYDLNSACSGFLMGMHTADAFIRAGIHKHVLVVAGEALSRALNMKDRTTCVLFGDGAGAAVVSATEVTDPENDSYIMGHRVYSQYDKDYSLAVLGGGSLYPPSHPDFGTKVDQIITMNGQEIFKLGTRGMARAAKDVMTECQFHPSKLDWFVPHQANIRMIEMVGKLFDFPMERTYVNLDRWGNTSAATMIVALAEMNRDGKIKKGHNVLLDVFGGGFSYGAMLLRW